MTTVRIFLSREGLIQALEAKADIRSIRVIRKAGVFVTDIEGLRGLDIAVKLEETPGAVLSNPDVPEKKQ